jgi:NodT family efflux transporter outer membrane factor (OMF) lipoprotein
MSALPMHSITPKRSEIVRLLWRLCVQAMVFLVLGGCTRPAEYIHNHFKVGPNYRKPPAMIAEHWIDEADKRVRTDCDDLAAWWAVMNDPLLDELIVYAYQQNLTLREAGFRIIEARAQLGIAIGEFFPQTQDWTGSYTRFGRGKNFFSSWNTNFNLAWELDFWGRFRRAIIAAEDTLDASVFNYDDVLVTLLGDVATNYVTIRTTQERMRLLENAIRVQTDVYTFILAELRVGVKVTELDRAQAESNLKQSLAQMEQFKIDLRLAENALCTLLGIPTIDLERLLNSAPKAEIPTVPNYVVVGVPADLLRRRPDVRRAERQAAAQAEQIGIAEAALYPAFAVSGTLGWQASTFSGLFSPDAFNSNVGPSFRWDLLNYGRLINNIRLQDATFNELVTIYQQTVLSADEEVEDGIVTFLKAQDRVKYLKDSVDAAYIALQVVIQQYQNPVQNVNPDFNRYAVILQNLITQQDQWAQARGQVVQGLIQVYRALGGGWQIRLQVPTNGGPGIVPPPLGPAAVPAPEEVPKPNSQEAPETLPAPIPVPPQS